jgi:hypothetical protein
MKSATDSLVARRAAAELLGVPAETTTAEARSIYLRWLERVDFVPSEEWCAGAAIVGGIALSGGLCCGQRVFDEIVGRSLCSDVEAFAREFWSMSPPGREEKWRLLRESCGADLALCKRLQNLSAGLSVEVQEFEDLKGSFADIAEFIKETFPLRPRDKACRQRQWLMGISEPLHDWAAAAARLRGYAPRVAQIDSNLLNELERLGESTYRLPPFRETQLPSGVNSKPTKRAFIGLRAFVVTVFAINLCLIAWATYHPTKPAGARPPATGIERIQLPEKGPRAKDAPNPPGVRP